MRCTYSKSQNCVIWGERGIWCLKFFSINVISSIQSNGEQKAMIVGGFAQRTFFKGRLSRNLLLHSWALFSIVVQTRGAGSLHFWNNLIYTLCFTIKIAPINNFLRHSFTECGVSIYNYILPVEDDLFKMNLENVKKSRFEMKKVWGR